MEVANIVAIDIVILPPRGVSKTAVSLNKEINNRYFSLGTSDYMPHMSLAMAYVDSLEEVGKVLWAIVAKTKPLKITLNKIMSKRMQPGWGGGRVQNLWNVERNNSLWELHKALVGSLPYVDVPKQPEMSFVDGENVSRLAMEYVAGFRFKNSGENYWPHVTLGNGDNEIDKELKKEFICSEIVLAQLGDFCTVRRVLARFNLGS